MVVQNPYRDAKFKLSTNLIEMSSRNGELDSLAVWIFLRARDLEQNGAATGRVYNYCETVRRVAQKMRRSGKTIRRNIDRACEQGWLNYDANIDAIYLTSLERLTRSKHADDFGGTDAKHRPLPDEHMRSLDSAMEIMVSIPEIWDADCRRDSHAKLLGIIRQKCTEQGLCRETYARLVGLDRSSTARVDRVTAKKRGWQRAYVRIADIGLTNQEAQTLVALYSRHSQHLPGRGRKIWPAKLENGELVLYTQLPVKWDTPFKGRLRPDRNVSKLAKSFNDVIHPVGCRSLPPVTYVDERDRDIMRGVGKVSDALRQSLWSTLQRLIDGMVLGRPVNLRPSIHVIDDVRWSGTSRPPNVGPSRDLKNVKDLFELNEYSSPKHTI